MKKIIKFILLLVVLSINIVFATTFPDIKGSNCEIAINYLAEKGIISGYEDGTYRPNIEVKRSEISLLIANSFIIQNNNELNMTFSDIENHWAEGYINFVSKTGLVKGYPDGSFRPQSNITYTEIFTILIRIIGKESYVDTNTTWPYNYIDLAKSLGINENINVEDYQDSVTRGDVAIAIYNTLLLYPELEKEKLPKIKFSESSLEVTESTNLIVTLENPPIGEYSFTYKIGDSSIIEAEWKEWITENSIPLIISPKAKGNTTIKVLLDNDNSVFSEIEVISIPPLKQADIIEWRHGGYESVKPYKEYEIKYVNGIKTSETRYSGKTKPQEVQYKKVDYSWEYPYGWLTWEYSLNIPVEAVNIYKSIDRRYITGYSYYVTHEEDDEYMNALANVFISTVKEEGYSEWDLINLAVSFVQSLKYVPDKIGTGYDEYPKFPLETLYDQGGDCEDSSILLASILRELGYGTVLVMTKDHMGVGLKTSDSGNFQFMNMNFHYIETTSPGWEIGELPQGLEGEKITILPVN